MIKNFAQDMAKMEVGKNWPYSFVNRHRNELGCTWFDGFDVARKRADSASRYKDYFELIRSKIEEYDIASCNTQRFGRLLALQQPTARELRRLVDKVELLRYENKGLPRKKWLKLE
ncbi:hypothetical protein HRG_012251 [Hirsutella rhossiliensis]